MLRLKNKKILFVGGGKVAERKILSIINEEADICVISPEITSRISQLAEENRICLKIKKFEETDVYDSYFLIFSCTDSRKVNESVTKLARKKGICINVADSPESCDFHMPSVMRHDGLTISVSTGGKSPKKAKATRKKLENFFLTQERRSSLEEH
jgi:precorrin-2 dehydrogenase/sirohydrochlorin ferrochelatase